MYNDPHHEWSQPQHHYIESLHIAPLHPQAGQRSVEYPVGYYYIHEMGVAWSGHAASVMVVVVDRANTNDTDGSPTHARVNIANTHQKPYQLAYHYCLQCSACRGFEGHILSHTGLRNNLKVLIPYMRISLWPISRQEE